MPARVIDGGSRQNGWRWHAGCSPAGVTPTLRDVIGAPLPRVPGFVPRPAHGPAPFRDLLGQAMASHVPGTSRPVAPSRPTPASAPAAAVPVMRGTSVAPVGRSALTTAIRHSSVTAGVDPALSVAVARAESNLDPTARSSDGLSVGTFQVTAATAAEMRRKIAAGTAARPPGVDDVALGVGYLRYLDDLFGKRARLGGGLETIPVADGDERRLFAVAAFNAGEGRVAQAQARAAAAGDDPTRFADIRRFLPTITRGYVERVTSYRRAEMGVG